MRVHELAKQLEISAKDLVQLLQDRGLPVKSHMSSIDEDTAAKFVQEMSPSEKKPSVVATKEKELKVKIVHEEKIKKEEKLEEIITPVEESSQGIEEQEDEAAGEEVPIVKIEKRTVEIVLPVTLSELAEKMQVNVNRLVSCLIDLGEVYHAQDALTDQDIVSLLAAECDCNVEFKKAESAVIQEESTPLEQEDESKLVLRHPVVAIMGHVDHGKTSLLDYIRKSRIALGESGGITQHIGAYQVEHNKHKITFLDTPGHEAFTKMRARGAKATDIVVLVVAGDDGIMPQTEEAISHCRDANVPMIIAINKLDKPDANPEKVKRQLSERNMLPEDWGGQTIVCSVSAKTGDGVDHLLDMILLQAEIMELKANPEGKATAIVIESRLSTGRGPVASILVKNGTFHIGDAVVSDASFGKIKAINNEDNLFLKSAGPSSAVVLMGLSEVPEVGSLMRVVKNDKFARMMAKQAQKIKTVVVKADAKEFTLEDVFAQIKENQIKGLRIILKADVKGSLEAVVSNLSSIGNEEVEIRIIHSAVGDVNENDVMLASASKAIILGFHVKASSSTKEFARKEGVEIRMYSVIYKLTEDVHMALEGLLSPKITPVVIGHALIRQVFEISRLGKVAGCAIVDGKVSRNTTVRVQRGGEFIHEGGIISLKRFKDEVKEVREGFECGIQLVGFDGVEEGDQFEFIEYKQELRTLDSLK
ncbi:MAG: translation initiation factor IF-2 [Chlamydiota bacterium]|nr:translation initiation factor IF-2 [Chlamydiota bacterium]